MCTPSLAHGYQQPAERIKHTFLLFDLHAHVDVDPHDDQIANDVKRADAHKDIWVFEWDLLARLHHHKDDYEIRSAGSYQYFVLHLE